jgi:hypothetical protein
MLCVWTPLLLKLDAPKSAAKYFMRAGAEPWPDVQKAQITENDVVSLRSYSFNYLP